MLRKTWQKIAMLMAPLALFSPAQADMIFEPAFDGYSWEELGFYGGVVDLDFLPNGNLLVVLKDGRVQIRSENNILIQTVINMQNEVNGCCDGGLMALVLDPDFETNPYIYINYAVETDPSNPDTSLIKYARISRFRLDASQDWKVVESGFSEEILLGDTWGDGILQESFFHISGEMDWGNDGTLLVSTGDSHIDVTGNPQGNDGYAPDRFSSDLDIGALRAQTLDNYNGKVLRLDRDTGLGLPTNPFYTGDPDDPASRIWVTGLREPWRMEAVPGTGSFDPDDGRPGILVIGDVGVNAYEELNITTETGGENFGWPFWEADNPIVLEGNYTPDVPFLDYNETIAPDVGISHDLALFDSFPDFMSTFEMSSMTAGIFYDHKTENPDAPTPYSELIDDKFFFADWGSVHNHNMYVGDFDNATLSFTDVELMASGNIRAGAPDEGIVDFSYSPVTGKIYALTFWRLYELKYDPTGAPPDARISKDVQSGSLPLTVSFDATETVNLSGSTLSFQWAVDGSDEIGATNDTFTFSFTENRNYEVSVTVTDGDGKSDTASTTVFAGNVPPVLTINQPTPFTKYPNDGTRVPIYYEATVVDSDGTTTPTISWEFNIATKGGANLHTFDRRTDFSGYVTMGTFDQPAFNFVEVTATDERGESVIETVSVYEDGEGPDAPTAAHNEWLLLR